MNKGFLGTFVDDFLAGNVSIGGALTVAGQIISDVLGVAPFVVASSIMVAGLNVEMLGGKVAADFEEVVTPGFTTEYYRGDKSWRTLNTAAVVESTNLYFTEARVRATPLTGFSATNAVIVAADTFLQGLNKAQGQINNISSLVTSHTHPNLYNATAISGNLNTLPTTAAGNFYYSGYGNVATNKPVSLDDANGIINIVSNVANYGKQIAFGNSDDLYTRSFAAGVFGSWKTLARQDWVVAQNYSVTSAGTTNQLVKYTSAGAIGNSVISEVSGNITVGGLGTGTKLFTLNNFWSYYRFNLGNEVTSYAVREPGILINSGNGTAPWNNYGRMMFMGRDTGSQGGFAFFRTYDVAASLVIDGNNNIDFTSPVLRWNGATLLSGDGTSTFIPKYTGASTFANSQISDTGSVINIGNLSFTARWLVLNNADDYFRLKLGSMVSAYTDQSPAILTTNGGGTAPWHQYGRLMFFDRGSAGTDGGMLFFTGTDRTNPLLELHQSGVIRAHKVFNVTSTGHIQLNGSAGTTGQYLKSAGGSVNTWGAVTSSDVTGALGYTPPSGSGTVGYYPKFVTSSSIGNGDIFQDTYYLTIKKPLSVSSSPATDYSVQLEANIGASVATFANPGFTKTWSLEYYGTDLRVSTGGYSPNLDFYFRESGAFSVRVTTGTAPFEVLSTTLVNNLNVQYLNGQVGSYYLGRANHTGTQTASTISDFTTTARGVISGTGAISYNSSTGVISYTGGASTDTWDSVMARGATTTIKATIKAGISIGANEFLRLEPTDYGTNKNALTFLSDGPIWYLASTGPSTYGTIDIVGALTVNGAALATASNTLTFTGKSGNISQWTNNSGYIVSANITGQYSLTGGGSAGNTTLYMSLVNDTASPGNLKMYGTDGSGVRGWYNQPSGGSSDTWQDVMARGNVVSVTPIIRKAAWSTGDEYFRLEPTDYGTGKPRFSIYNDTSLGTWSIYANDGISFANINFVGGLTINGVSVITASSTTTLTNKSGNISQWTNNSGYVTNVVSALGYTPMNSTQTAYVYGTNSIAGGGNTIGGTQYLGLVNDISTPGGDKLYGTNSSGIKGWYNQPSGGGGSGTVTSVGLIAPSGFNVPSFPVTTSGNITLAFDSGYSIVSPSDRSAWNAAAGGGVSGPGSPGYIPFWTGSNSLGDSPFYVSGSSLYLQVDLLAYTHTLWAEAMKFDNLSTSDINGLSHAPGKQVWNGTLSLMCYSDGSNWRRMHDNSLM